MIDATSHLKRAEPSNDVARVRVVVLACAAIAVVITALNHASPTMSDPPEPTDLLPLIAGECVQSSEVAESWAHLAMARAHGHWERAVFAPDATWKAITTAADAANCFRQVGAIEAADAADAMVAAYRAAAQAEYVRLKLVLHVSRRRDDVERVRVTARRLHGLLEGHDSDYRRWLWQLAREVT